MECGDGVICQIVEAWQRIVELVFFIGPLSKEAVRFVAGLSDNAKNHLQNLATLASASFGLWKLFAYRERVLFDKLDRYLLKETRNLERTRQGVFESVLRPNLHQPYLPPVLAAASLAGIVERRDWPSLLTFRSRTQAADLALQTAALRLQEERIARLRRHAQLEQLLATTHLVRGVISAAHANAASETTVQRDLSHQAILHFDDALRTSEDESDLDALELKAHQLLQIGETENADAALEILEARTRPAAPSKGRSLRLARVFRMQALIKRNAGTPGLAKELTSLALSELAAYSPLAGQDLLEQAAVNELHSSIAEALRFNRQASTARSDALIYYKRLADQTGPSNFIGGALRWLRKLMKLETLRDNLFVAAKLGIGRTQ
jgi:hypothetical protein